jgi:hypothetical protein
MVYGERDPLVYKGDTNDLESVETPEGLVLPPQNESLEDLSNAVVQERSKNTLVIVFVRQNFTSCVLFKV